MLIKLNCWCFYVAVLVFCSFLCFVFCIRVVISFVFFSIRFFGSFLCFQHVFVVQVFVSCCSTAFVDCLFCACLLCLFVCSFVSFVSLCGRGVVWCGVWCVKCVWCVWCVSVCVFFLKIWVLFVLCVQMCSELCLVFGQMWCCVRRNVVQKL